MITSTQPNTLVHMAGNTFVLLINAEREIMHHLVSRVSIQGNVFVMDCACAFNANRVQEIIHYEQVYFEEAMERICVTRPFTAYQLNSALEALSTASMQGIPMIIMRPLHLLYDENIRLDEATRLLKAFIKHLTVLKSRSPIAVFVHTPPADAGHKESLLRTLAQAADRVLTPEESREPTHQQLTLF